MIIGVSFDEKPGLAVGSKQQTVGSLYYTNFFSAGLYIIIIEIASVLKITFVKVTIITCSLIYFE